MTDLAAVDWHAFARRHGFDNAGDGVQDRHASETTLLGALGVDSAISGSPEAVLKRAVDHPDVPLSADDRYPRYYFADEVLNA